MPTNENGPRALSDFIKQSGKRATVVTPSKACVLVTLLYGVKASNNVGTVSLRIMEYASTLQDVTMKHAKAGSQLVLAETDLSQA